MDLLLSIFEQNHGHLPELLILDEIQNVGGWERWVRSCIDQALTKVIVTGSNAKLLSAELATSLTGRALEHTAWPLSLSSKYTDSLYIHTPLITKMMLEPQRVLSSSPLSKESSPNS